MHKVETENYHWIFKMNLISVDNMGALKIRRGKWYYLNPCTFPQTSTKMSLPNSTPQKTKMYFSSATAGMSKKVRKKL